MFSLNLLLPTISWMFVFTDTSQALNECLGKGYLNFFETRFQFCSNEDQFMKMFCWSWFTLLQILMSDVIDVFCIFFCFKEINKSTEESRSMLSKQAYINRKRYNQIHCLKNLQQSLLYSKIQRFVIFLDIIKLQSNL